MYYMSATNHKTPTQAASDIAVTDVHIFTVLDALNQCPLKETSPYLLHLKYLGASYGLLCISEHNHQRMLDAFSELRLLMNS